MLRVAAIATLTLAVLGALPGPVGDATAATAVFVVTATPILRVAWLAVGWLRAGDLPFAVAAGVLLAVVLGGSGVAALFA